MKTPSSPIYKSRYSVAELNGYDGVTPATLMHPSLSPSLLNMVFRDLIASKRTGYSEAGGDGTAMIGTPMEIVEFEDAAGTKSLVCFTTLKTYTFDETNDAWDDVTPRWTVTGGDDAGKRIDVTADVTDYIDAKMSIVVTGSTSIANQTYNVASVTWNDPKTEIVVDEALSGEPSDGVVEIRRTGTELNPIVVTQGVDKAGTWMVSTSAVDYDYPQRWDGSGNFTPCVPGKDLTYDGFKSAGAMEIYEDYSFLGRINTASEEYRTIVWSDTGDFFTYKGSNNSGANILSTAKGEILRYLRLGRQLVVYNNRSIIVVTHVGGVALFTFEKMFDGEGLVGPRAVVNLGPYHVYMGRDNFYLFDGTSLVREIGTDRINKYLRDNLDYAYTSRAFGFVHEAEKLVYWIIPTGDGTSEIVTMSYNLANPLDNKWSLHEYNDRPTAMGLYSRQTTLSWDGLETLDSSLTWDALQGSSIPWTDYTTQTGFPVRMSGSGVKAYFNDSTWPNDDGAAIPSHWDSRDFLDETYKSLRTRWIEIEVELKGTLIDVLYSTDQGVSWTYALSEVDGSDADGSTLTSAWTKYRFLLDTVSQTLRVRLQCSDESKTYDYRWLSVWGIAGEPS